MLKVVCLKNECIQATIDLVGCIIERRRNSQVSKSPLNNGLQCMLKMVGQKEPLEKTGLNEIIARVNVPTGWKTITLL